MKNFITSIHLKDAENTDYERLDKEMKKEQFAKMKPNRAAGKEIIPVAREYNYEGGISIQAVTAAAYRAARRTGKLYSFTVIKRK